MNYISTWVLNLYTTCSYYFEHLCLIMNWMHQSWGLNSMYNFWPFFFVFILWLQVSHRMAGISSVHIAVEWELGHSEFHPWLLGERLEENISTLQLCEADFYLFKKKIRFKSINSLPLNIISSKFKPLIY